MIADYSCNLSETTFSDNDGSDEGANVYTGPAGFQAAIRGTGAATALASGKTLEITGTGDLSRLVRCDCNGQDYSAWTPGQVVENFTGGGAVQGDEWTGVVVQANDDPVGGMGADDMVLIWLDDDSTFTDVSLNEAAGIINVPAAQSTSPLTDSFCDGIQVDTNSGTSILPIQVVGVNSAWAEDGTYAILDGGGKATNIILSSKSWWQWRNIHGKNSASHLFSGSGYTYWHNCIAENSGAHGWVPGNYTNFYGCKAFDCNTDGFGAYGKHCNLTHCIAYNCGSEGFYVYVGQAVGCIAYECETGFRFDLYGSLYNCVADSNNHGLWGLHGINMAVGCRITNNTAYGIRGDRIVHDQYSFYSGNGANFENDIHDDLVDGEHTRITTGAIGYVDGDNGTFANRDYRIKLGSAGYRSEVPLSDYMNIFIQSGIANVPLIKPRG